MMTTHIIQSEHCDTNRETDELVPFQSLAHQTVQRLQTGHSFSDETSRDKLPETSGYSAGTETKNILKKTKITLLFSKLVVY